MSQGEDRMLGPCQTYPDDHCKSRARPACGSTLAPASRRGCAVMEELRRLWYRTGEG
jgi:hypothetical protein